MYTRWLIAIAALLLSACSGVETVPADTAAFSASGFTRYAWRSEALSQEGYHKDKLYQADPIIRDALSTRLTELGYQQVPREDAQFLVDYMAVEGMKDGVLARGASNVTPYPMGNINRQIDGASVDNAYALGGAKETGNLMIVFLDAESADLLWRVGISALIQNANSVDTDALRQVVRKGLTVLPEAPR